MQLKVRDGEPFLCEPVVIVSLTPGELKQYTGTYYSKELDATYYVSVNVKENQLVYRSTSSQRKHKSASSRSTFPAALLEYPPVGEKTKQLTKL